MVIFHSHVSLPEGKSHETTIKSLHIPTNPIKSHKIPTKSHETTIYGWNPQVLLDHVTSELDSDTLRVAGASAVGDRAELLRGTGAPLGPEPGNDMALRKAGD